MTDLESLKTKIQLYKMKKTQMEDIETEVKDLRDQIVDGMKTLNKSKVQSGDLTATLSSYTSESFNKARFKKDHPELYFQYYTTSFSDRLQVK